MAETPRGQAHLGLFLQAQTVAPVRGKGLLDQAPVPQVEVLTIREDLGMWGSSRYAGIRLPFWSPSRTEATYPLFASSHI